MAIEDHDIDRLREIFVTRKECEKTKDAIEKKLLNYIDRLELIAHEVTGLS